MTLYPWCTSLGHTCFMISLIWSLHLYSSNTIYHGIIIHDFNCAPNLTIIAKQMIEQEDGAIFPLEDSIPGQVSDGAKLHSDLFGITIYIPR